jgi:hypothetical protein
MRRSEIYIPLFFLFVACVLLVMHRMYYYEGFVSNDNGIPCGVDLPSCADGTRCFNGFCGADIKPYLPPSSGLPVLPAGKSYL